MRENFLKNVSAIENTLFKSESFKYLSGTGLEKEAIAGVIAEIYKQAIAGAVNLEELALKSKSENLAYEKAKMEMELGILSAKAQIKLNQAEAIKSLIQAKSMVRSVVDNAAINKANNYTGLSNVIGNASEQKALTAPDMTGQGSVGIAQLAVENIEKIDTTPITDFDDLLKDLISDDDFVSKDISIYAEKQLIMQGEVIVITGFSSFGSNESEFLLNGEQVASNTRSYLFEARELGDFVVTFRVKNDKDEWLKDTLTLKVVENLSAKEQPPLKKF